MDIGRFAGDSGVDEHQLETRRRSPDHVIARHLTPRQSPSACIYFLTFHLHFPSSPFRLLSCIAPHCGCRILSVATWPTMRPYSELPQDADLQDPSHHDPPPSGNQSAFRLYWLTAIVCCGGLLFGYDSGVIGM